MASATDADRPYADVNVYKLPNDSPEQSRLDDQHRRIRIGLGGRTNFAAVDQPRHILEIGCGTGPCTRDFGTQYPSATVYGVDLTPVPDAPSVTTPPNVEYITGNIRDLAGSDQRLPFASFDYIFSRLLVYGMPDWPGYIKTAAALTAPGGWVEMQDLDVSISFADGVRNPEWLQIIHQVAAEQGMDIRAGAHIAGHMRDAGLTDIQVKEVRWPLGNWMAKTNPETVPMGEYIGPQIGAMQVEFVKVMLGNDSRWSDDEVKRLQKQAFESMQPTDGAFVPYYIVTGRKPAL